MLAGLRPDRRRAEPLAAPSSTVVGGVFGQWQEAVGPAVADHVQPVRLDGSTLTVEVDDPAWATQVAFFESTIKQRLADVAGATVTTVLVRVRRGAR